jgi:hypothetical protein
VAEKRKIPLRPPGGCVSAWGYAGNPLIQGYLGGGCAPQQRHKSLSERGLLYRPFDLNFR